VSVALSEPAPIGHNRAPHDAAPDPFAAIKLHCDDLYERATPWLTGAPITTDAQAEEVDQFLKDARQAFSAANAQRVEENEPFDTGKAAVQEKYAPLIGKTKTVTGSMLRLQAACLAVLDPWRKKKADEAAAAAEALRQEAAKRAAEAAEAAKAASGDLEATEAAEELVRVAQTAQRDATRAEKAATTGTGLRTVYVATMTDNKVAFRHYLNDQPEEFLALAQRLADIDVRNGKRAIPGFDVKPTKVAV
jgi:hypothetical protein